MQKSFLLIVLSILFAFSANIYSQSTENGTGTYSTGNFQGDNSASENVKSEFRPKVKSSEAIELEKQIQALREQNNPSNQMQIEQLNEMLGKVTGNFVTAKVDPYPGGVQQVINPPFIEETDAIGNVRLFSSTSYVPKAMGTVTEQRGTTAGRIWAVYAFSANTSTPDSIRVLYSSNNGLTWIGYANAWLGGTDKINYDDLDIELLEGTTGDKYLWIVYGLRATGGSGRWFTGGFVLNVTTFAGGLFSFSWPGNDAAKRYYNMRITSDNSHWVTGAWIYLACSFDSLGASSWRVNTQKFARSTSPYTTTPTISYMPTKYWWYSGAAPANFQRTLSTDIAYFRNTNDSIIVSFSGVPDSTTVFFAKSDINGNAPTAGFSQKGTETTAYKYGARLVSSNTASGTAVIFNQLVSGVNYIKYFRALNGNFANPSGQSALVTFLKTTSGVDVASRRGINSFYYSYVYWGTGGDSLRMVYLNPLASGSLVNGKLNHNVLLTATISPKPGFRNVSSDSCFALFNLSGPQQVWAAYGCTGTVTGINDPIIPSDYSLSQNYPNPFNPTTTVEFSIPKSGLVTLKIYDVLGKEVGVVVNEVKNAGSYRVDINASNLTSGVYFYKLEAGDFSQIKKMMLLK